MQKPLRIIIVEDSEDDAALLLRQLRQGGYNPVYEIVETEDRLIAALENQQWDIVVSDYVLPSFSGLDTLRVLGNKKLDIPCVIVSGKITDETAVAAMRAGARDYITKDNLSRLGPVVERELSEAIIRQESRIAEEKGREAEQKYRYLFNAMTDAFIYCEVIPDENGKPVDYRILEANSAFETATGIPAEMAKGKTARELVPGLESWWIEILSRVALTGKPSHIENQVKELGRWLEVYAYFPRPGYLVTIIRDITDRKNLEETLEDYARRITQVQEEERKRVARELHDDTAQRLSMLSLELDAVIHRSRDLPASIVQQLEQLKKNTDRILEDVRRFSHELRPGILDHLGLQAALEQLIGEMTESKRFAVRFEPDGEECRLPDDIELALFRIAQEALNNIRKHAQATEVIIRLGCSPEKIQLEIIDNGKGFNPEIESEAARKRGSMGLLGMKERAQLIGADIKINSKPNTGTTISVVVST